VGGPCPAPSFKEEEHGTLPNGVLYFPPLASAASAACLSDDKTQMILYPIIQLSCEVESLPEQVKQKKKVKKVANDGSVSEAKVKKGRKETCTNLASEHLSCFRPIIFALRKRSVFLRYSKISYKP
jgi:hypothetical protein